MGPEVNVLYSAVRISSWLFWTVGSYLHLPSTEHFSLFPLRAWDRPGTADTWITESEDFVPDFIKVHLAIWLWREIITDSDVTELVLESDSDAHFSEDQDIAAQSDSDNDSDTDVITGIKFTQWTDNTNCWPICFDCKTRKTSSIHEPTKQTWHKPQQALPYAIWCCVFSTKTKKQKRNSSTESAT